MTLWEIINYGRLSMYCISRKFDWKNVGDLENKFIQQIKFDDCPGSQYYF